MDHEEKFRFAEAEFHHADGNDRTVEVSFSSENPVKRRDADGSFYWEVLSHAAGDYDLSRLTSGGPCLYGHDDQKQIGAVLRAWVADRRGKAVIKFSRNEFADEIFRDLQDGIRSKTSFGYAQTKLLSSTPGADGLPVHCFAWSAYEVSVVAVPADDSVGVGRSHKFETNEPEPVITRNMKSTSAFDRLAETLLESRSKAPTISETIRALVNGRVTPDVQDESARLAAAGMAQLPNSGMGVSGCTFVSFATLRRDLQVGSYNLGGALVGEDKLAMAFPLMNQTIAEKCGARIITGLRGACFLPRWTSLPTAESLAESETAGDSTPGTDQIRTAPHRVSVNVTIDRLLEVLSPGTSQSLTQLILKALAVKIDSLFLFGQGAGNEPLGILNTEGIGTATFGGAATYDGIVSLEESLTDKNVECDPATTWYFTSPKCKTKFKKLAKAAGITQPAWESVGGVDYMNGYRARATNQMAANNQVAICDFSQTALCVYSDGIELQYNPFIFDREAKTRITAHVWVDVLADHAEAIACSTDAGNQ